MRVKRLHCIIGGLVWVAVSVPAHAEFEGFGATTPRDSQAPTLAVTSLSDSGAGTLREALRGPSNRRVVFNVGGTITLRRNLALQNATFVMIDGASAPPPGITLEGHGLTVRDSQGIIVTHVRVRNAKNDGISITNSRNVVVDHCSVTNSGDENVSITEGSRDVTVSWCIIGDTEVQHSTRNPKGMLIANFTREVVSRVSLHHNLFINASQRSPQVSTAGLVDVRNNVIANWQAYGVRFRQGAHGNILNNVFRSGQNPQNAVILTPDAGRVHVGGNRGPGRVNVNALSTSPTPFPVERVSTDPVEEVEDNVRRAAGASPRDEIDRRLAAQTSAARSDDEVRARAGGGGASPGPP